MDCSPPGSSVHGILQARILEWVAMSSSLGSFWRRDGTHVLYLLYWQVGFSTNATWEAHFRVYWCQTKVSMETVIWNEMKHEWCKFPGNIKDLLSHKGSLVAQSVKNLPAMQETWVPLLGKGDPLEKEVATHSSVLAWKIPLTEEPGELQFMESLRARHDWATENVQYRHEHI